MAVDAFRLGPFAALSGTLEDDRSNQSHPLKGGFNYRVMGGEVWPRHTLDMLGATEGLRLPFTHCITIPGSYTLQLLIGPMACLKIADFASTYQILLSPTYDPSTSCSITLTQGSRVPTIGAGTAPVIGQWFIVNNVKPAAYSEYYSIGSGINLTRPYVGPTVTFTADFYDPIIPVASGLFNFGTTIKPGALCLTNCDATVFRQAIAHVADDAWTGSPALLADTLYIIYTSNLYGPTAISIFLEEPIKRDIFRDTSVSPPDPLPTPPAFCETFKQRLLYAFVSPPDTNEGSEQTFWWSEIGDILSWHRVVLGVDFPNYRTNFAFTSQIRGMKTLGDRAIIHYTDRQEMISSTGSNSEPFIIEENNQQLGMIAPRSLVPVGRLHYFWSQVGPVSFDGTDVSPLGGEIADILAREAGSPTLPWDNPQLAQQGVMEIAPSMVVSWKNESRQEVYYAVGTEREQQYPTTEKCFSVYVYNWDKEEWSIDAIEIQNLSSVDLDYILLPVWGGGSGVLGVNSYGYEATQFIFLANGTVLLERPILQYAYEPGRSIPRYHNVGPIFDDNVMYSMSPHIMEMRVETGWQDFDSPYQKDLLLLEIDVRDTRMHGWNSIRPRRGWNYDPGADDGYQGYLLVDVYADYNMITPVASLEVIVDHTQWPRTRAIKLSEQGIGGPGIRYAPVEEGHNGPGRQTIRKKLRVQGQVFKFVFTNPAPPTGDHNKMLFIVSQVTCWYMANEGHIRRMLADEGA